MSEQTPVFRGDLLQADLFNPTGRRLFVSFRQRVQADGDFDTPRPARTFVSEGFAHLHIQSRWNDWFINAETRDLEAAVRRATGGYGRRVAMGFSMGGYAALRFSKVLDLRHVLLVAPQFSIHPGVVPWDSRFHRSSASFDPALGDLVQYGRRQLAGGIMVDPFRPLDMKNARLIQGVFGRLAVCRVAGAGHQAAKVINAGSGFGALQRVLIDAPINRRHVIDLHRQGRRGSADYWTELGKVAEKRGHIALFHHAEARVAELTGAEHL